MARTKVVTAPKKTKQPDAPAPRRPVAPVPPAPSQQPKKQAPAPVKPPAPVTKPRAELHVVPGAKVRGESVMTDLDAVKPNTWNPNVMTDFQKQSLRAGLVEDGWIASQSLLVWGNDEKGKPRNIIIDGEHRWVEAKALGMQQGPMVFLHGLTEAQAKALTVKLDNKRGKFDTTLLRELLSSIDLDPSSSLSLGFTDADLTALMNPAVVLPPGDFSEVTIDAKTDYCCPKCGYEWSGQSKKQAKEKAE